MPRPACRASPAGSGGTAPRRSGRRRRARASPRRELAAVPVQVLAAATRAGRRTRRARSSRRRRAVLRRDALPDLQRHHVAERVGREVADRAARPVHVLEHAVGVVAAPRSRGTRPSSRSTPPAGRAARSRPSIDVLLELEAQDDVHVVGDLVRVDADQRRAHAVDGRGTSSPRSTRRAAPGTAPARAGRRSARTGRLRPTRFSHMRLCDSCRPSETPEPSGVRSSSGVDLVLVEPVAVLVHRREERVEVPLDRSGS